MRFGRKQQQPAHKSLSDTCGYAGNVGIITQDGLALHVDNQAGVDEMDGHLLGEKRISFGGCRH